DRSRSRCRARRQRVPQRPADSRRCQGRPPGGGRGGAMSAERGETSEPVDRPSLESEIARVAWNADGLAPVVVQQHDSREVLMMAWMDVEALRRTLTEGRAVYWSRSRQEYWRKG